VRHPAVTPNRSDERIPGSLATLVPRNDGAVPRMLRDAPRKRRGALLIRGPSISVCEDVGPGFSRSSVARCIASGTPDIACAKNRISSAQSVRPGMAYWDCDSRSLGSRQGMTTPFPGCCATRRGSGVVRC